MPASAVSRSGPCAWTMWTTCSAAGSPPSAAARAFSRRTTSQSATSTCSPAAPRLLAPCKQYRSILERGGADGAECAEAGGASWRATGSRRSSARTPAASCCAPTTRSAPARWRCTSPPRAGLGRSRALRRARAPALGVRHPHLLRSTRRSRRRRRGGRAGAARARGWTRSSAEGALARRAGDAARRASSRSAVEALEGAGARDARSSPPSASGSAPAARSWTRSTAAPRSPAPPRAVRGGRARRPAARWPPAAPRRAGATSSTRATTAPTSSAGRVRPTDLRARRAAAGGSASH